jgi:hypothetical protein
MRFLLNRAVFFAILIAIPFTTASVSRAQESSPQWCRLEQLDLDLRLPPEPPSSPGRKLVIAIRNRSESDCKLPPLSVGFPPTGPDLMDIFDKTYYKDASKSAAEFKETSRRLGPGDEAHVLLAWSSVPVEYHGIVMGDCNMHDTMTVYSDPSHPALEVRHLWIQSCDQIWASSYRPGPYVPGEPVSDEWLQRVQLKESDFRQDPLPDSKRTGDTASSETHFWALLDVQYFRGNPDSGYYGAFPLFLKTSPQASGICPFRSLRKREADGQTTIYLSHCEDESQPVAKNEGSNQVGFFDVDFGLAPERAGRVEYEAISEVHGGSEPTFEKAKLELLIRDPNRPMLPTIDTSAPNCHVSQLRLTSPTVQLGSHWDRGTAYPPQGEDWYDGKVFEVTNISDQTCMIGGLPDLKFQRPSWWTSGGVAPPVCRNCTTPLFKPRESRWIELKPGDSAHFMIARALSAYWPACTATGGIDMRLPGDTQALSLPFEASFCGEIPATAWRSGKYDGDPMNAQYDRNEDKRQKEWQGRAPLGTSKVACLDSTKTQSELHPPGPQCADQEFAKRGRPSMSAAHDGVALGFSTPQRDSTTVSVWMDNQTNEPHGYSTCSRSGVLDDVDVYDSAGHRLLSKKEQAQRKACAEHREFWSISSGCGTVTVAPHTMQVVGWGDLQDIYVLSPGRFFIVPSEVRRQTCESLNKPQEGTRQASPSNAVMMMIPD